ncbi:MAG: class I SAM-dependent DNA methyltransferase [Rhizobiaceae bacterium]
MSDGGKDSKTHGIDKYHHFDGATDQAEQLKSVYSQWADQYDHDNDHKLGTVSQPMTVEMLSRHLSNRGTEIMDVGCGTGLVGHHLAAAGFTTYDGTDISSEMMQHARTRGYRQLLELVTDTPLPVLNGAYDATLCVGVFTHGHLGPEGIDELMRITRTGGLICFTVNEGVWESGGFPSRMDELTKARKWRILEHKKRDYMIRENVKAHYIAAVTCPTADTDLSAQDTFAGKK